MALILAQNTRSRKRKSLMGIYSANCLPIFTGNAIINKKNIKAAKRIVKGLIRLNFLKSTEEN